MGSTAWLLRCLFATMAMLIAAFMPWIKFKVSALESVTTQNAWATHAEVLGFNLPNWLPLSLFGLVLTHSLFLWLDVRALRSTTVLVLLAYCVFHTGMIAMMAFASTPERSAEIAVLQALQPQFSGVGSGAFLSLGISLYLLASLVALLLGSRAKRPVQATGTLPQVPSMPTS